MNNGTINNIEGDGTVISGTSINQPTQIFTPVMNVYGSIEVSFKYRVNAVTGNGVRRWIKVYLTYAMALW